MAIPNHPTPPPATQPRHPSGFKWSHVCKLLGVLSSKECSYGLNLTRIRVLRNVLNQSPTLEHDIQMDTTSKWRRPQNEDDLKMEMTWKWRWPQNKAVLKINSPLNEDDIKWRHPHNEDDLKIKTTLEWRQPQNEDILKIKTIICDKQEMEWWTYVCTSFHFCQLFTDHWRGRTFCSVLFYFVLFCFVLFCSVLFCFILFYFVLFYFILFYFIFLYFFYMMVIVLANETIVTDTQITDRHTRSCIELLRN